MVGRYGTNDPFELCDYLDIIVAKEDMGSLNGFYTLSDGTGCIYINKSLDGPAQRAICAHELGHAVLHTDVNIRFLTECTFLSANRLEGEANRFGAYLLLHDIAARIGDYHGWTFQAVAANEYVPVEYVEIVFKSGVPPVRQKTPVPVTPAAERVVDEEVIRPVLDGAALRERRVAAFMRRVRKRIKDTEPRRAEERRMAAEGFGRRGLNADELAGFLKGLR
jgi:Zn-dependent peptidase ImmA (M78 family)